MLGRNDLPNFSQSVSRPQGTLPISQGNPFSNSTPSISRISATFPANAFQSVTPSNPIVPSSNPFTPASSLLGTASSKPPNLGQGVSNPFSTTNVSNQFPSSTGFAQASSLIGQSTSNLANQNKNSLGAFPSTSSHQNVSSGFFTTNPGGYATSQPSNIGNSSSFAANPGLATSSQPNLFTGGGFTGGNPLAQTGTGISNNSNIGFSTGLQQTTSNNFFATNPNTGQSNQPLTNFFTNNTGAFGYPLNQPPNSQIGHMNPIISTNPQQTPSFIYNMPQVNNYQLNPNQVIHNLLFEDSFNFRFKPIDSLSDPMQRIFQHFQEFCNSKEDALTKSENCLKNINLKVTKAYEKSEHILRQIRKVMSIQKRFIITMENKKEMENHIVTYVNDLLKTCKYAERNDPYYTFKSPAEFMMSFIEICDKRLTAIQSQVEEIEEIIRNESCKESFKLLITVIKELHEKFQIISSLAHEVHSRIDGLLFKLNQKHRDIPILAPVVPQNNFEKVFEQALNKENKNPENMAQAKISDIITGPIYRR